VQPAIKAALLGRRESASPLLEPLTCEPFDAALDSELGAFDHQRNALPIPRRRAPLPPPAGPTPPGGRAAWSEGASRVAAWATLDRRTDPAQVRLDRDWLAAHPSPDPTRPAPEPALHLLGGIWIASCPTCGYQLTSARTQARCERRATRRVCSVCHLDGTL
jgi:hypothetical protein